MIKSLDDDNSVKEQDYKSLGRGVELGDDNYGHDKEAG
jgi:hypothetical protein